MIMAQGHTNILVTGGAGFLASTLARNLEMNPAFRVWVVDNLSTGDLRKVPESLRTTFIKADVNDYQGMSAIMTSRSFDYVFHYAAVVGVRRTLDNPVSVLRDIDGIRNILELSKNTGVKRVFFTSSSEVYGEPVEFPQNERTTPLNSRLPYAVVKNVGEAFCRSYQQEYGLDYTIFRFFNTYGPLQSPDFVISRFIRAAVCNEPIRIYGDGKQTRTFCYVDDNVEAVTRCLNDNRFINDVVNIGSSEECSIFDLARLIVRMTESESKIEFLPPLKEGDMTRRKPDIEKMNQLLGRSTISLEEGIERILRSETFFELNTIPRAAKMKVKA